jgi:preprotein translocase subunit SecE
MGRIQRKKPSGAKKKKKQRVENKSAAVVRDPSLRGLKKVARGESEANKNRKKLVLPQKKQSAATSAAATKPKDNIVSKSTQFLREVKVELKKVTWPSRKQTIGSTVVVIALVMLISLFLGVVDLGISSLIRIVLQ